MLAGLYAKVFGILKIVVKIFIGLFVGLGLLSGSTGDILQQSAENGFMQGDTSFVRQASAGSFWTVGFNKVISTPSDALTNADKYYLAGYNNNTHPTEIMDDLYVRTIYIDDNSGRGGVLLAVIDAIGFSNKDVLDVRERIADFATENNIKSVNVACTHVHAGIDTLGLWGNMSLLQTGRNKVYNEHLKDLIAQSMKDAFTERKAGKLYWGDILPEHDLFNDNRAPFVYDKTITRIRFGPLGTENNRSDDLYMVSLNAHPECMAPTNSTISADFPAYMGRYIAENSNGADYILFNGAVGVLVNGNGLGDVFDIVDNKIKLFENVAGTEQLKIDEIKTRMSTILGATSTKLINCLNSFTQNDLDENGYLKADKKTEYRKAYTMAYGETIGRYVCEIDNRTEHSIEPFINIRFNPITVWVENTLLELGARIGLINANSYDSGKFKLDTAITSEVGYLELGNSLRILMAPGELAAEYAMGGFLPAAQSALNYDMNCKPGFEIIDPDSSANILPRTSKNLVFGLMNDEMGYIISDNDFYVHRFLPYLANDNDRFGISHYEEGVSTGPKTGKQLLNEWQSIYDNTH